MIKLNSWSGKRNLISPLLMLMIFLLSAPFVLAGAQNRMYYNASLLVYPYNSTYDNSTQTNDFNSIAVYTDTAKHSGQGSLYFDGNAGGYPLSYPSATVSNTYNKTIVLWTNVSIADSNENSYFITQYDYSLTDGTWWFGQMYGSTTEVQSGMTTNGGYTVSANYFSSALFHGTWTMLTMVITWNGTINLEIYENETLVASNSQLITAPVKTSAAVYIGDRYQHVGVTDYKGGLDDIYIINYSMTPNDISVLYNLTKNGDELKPESAAPLPPAAVMNITMLNANNSLSTNPLVDYFYATDGTANNIFCNLTTSYMAQEYPFLEYFTFEEGAENITTGLIHSTRLNHTKANFTNSKSGNNTGAYSIEYKGVNGKSIAENNPYLHLYNNFTILLWLYPNSTTGIQSILTKAMGDGKLEYYIARSTNTLYFMWTPDNLNYKFAQSSTATLTAGEWNMIGITKDAGNVTFYINSNSQKVASAFGMLQNGTGNVGLGFNINSNTEYLNGKIDNLALINRTLSAAEIARYYEGTFATYTTMGTNLLNYGAFSQNQISTLNYTSLYPNYNNNFTISCIDAANSAYSSKYLNITIDGAYPTIAITKPANLQSYNRNYDLLNISASCNDNYYLNYFTANLSNSTFASSYLGAVNLNLSNINTSINISNYGIGAYSLIFKCQDLAGYNSSTVYTVYVSNILLSNAVLISPANNSMVNSPSIELKYQESTSSNCSLYLNSTYIQSMDAAMGNNTFLLTELNNQTREWQVRCVNSISNSTSKTWVYNIYYSGAADVIGSSISLGTCAITSIFGLLLWGFFFALAFIIMAFGFWFKHGLVGALGGFILLFDAMYIFSCFAPVALLLTAISIFLMYFFVRKGYLGQL